MIAVPIGTLVCVVALLATSVASHALMFLHKTRQGHLSFIFICHMTSPTFHVVRQHCHGTLYRLWVVILISHMGIIQFGLNFPYFLVSTPPARKTQVLNLSLDVFSFVSFIAAALGTRVPHWDSATSTHYVNLL
jgi:hypothetical protein